jgi:hypothetical protein
LLSILICFVIAFDLLCYSLKLIFGAFSATFEASPPHRNDGGLLEATKKRWSSRGGKAKKVVFS